MAHKSFRLSIGAAAVWSTLAAGLFAQQVQAPQSGMTSPPPGHANIPSGLPNGNAPHQSSLSSIPADFVKLKMAPGFLFNVQVINDSDFSGDFRIEQDGTVTLPYIGKMHVAGETVTEVQADIQKKLLDDQLVQDPQVIVSVSEYTAEEVTVVGEVASPGKIQLLVPHPLTDVLALAGGLTITSGDTIVISHRGAESETVRYSRATNAGDADKYMVSPGDTVQVKRAGVVYVLGAVTKPGGYVMQEDGKLTVLEAISLASGTGLPASVSKIYVLRRNTDGSAIKIEIPLSKMQKGGAGDMALAAADVVYVPQGKIKTTLLNAQGILASATSSSIIATAVY
jgi:polysaccharide biosynthesis/export protein